MYEGTVLARLVDSSGRRIVEFVGHARAAALPDAAGSPRWSPSPPRAKSGTLIVFDQSMEDGSRQDEVKIPVTFAAD